MPGVTKFEDRYELKEVLAKGGMGVVYRAVDGVMKRQVAIKTLLDITDTGGLQLFQKECEVLASMTHPNIIEIYDVGHFQQDGVSRPYLVMPLLPGVTLEHLIRTSSQRLTVERSIDIVCQACRGLQAAHDKGLVHRDIKPSNIFVLEDDSIKIIDFGVAHRLEGTRTVGRKGTLLYMAPEQIAMKPVSAVSDIFSLGVVCYEMLTRNRPFKRATENSVADAILHFIPVPASELNPAVNQAVSQAVHKAMAKQPWHRFAAARDFAETLQKALRNEPIEIFNPARMRPRLQRAMETLERGDYQYASEIVNELEGEGHLDPAISDLRRKIDDAIRKKTIAQLLDTAHSRVETEEYPLALQKIYEILQLDPSNAEALSLQSSVENKRTEHDMEEWFRLAAQHLERFDFSHAREALQRVLQLRPQEGRAMQMLFEVEHLEQEHERARREKEQLYQDALAADQRGDISAALSNLERVLDLDRRVPDAAAPERATNFQNLYNKVRSEHEIMQRAYAEAKHQLDAGEYPTALATCADQLAKYPGNALFQALKIDVEERHRQALSARIAETDRKVAAEADLDRRIAIVEDAVRANPGERHFEQLLHRTREKQSLIESIVLRARLLEQQAQFAEALSQWEIVKTIYDRYPGLSVEVDRVLRRRDQHLRLAARNGWVEQIDRTLESRDYDRALELLAKAQAEHPGDSELAQLETLARQGLEKSAESHRLISNGQEACAARRYEEGITMLTRAYDLDNRNPAVRGALRQGLTECARGLIESDPASAEKFVRQALQLDPEDGGAKNLLSLLEDRRRHEAVDRFVSEARQLQSLGDLRAALEVVENGLQAFPGEARLVQLKASLKTGLDEVRRRDLDEVRRLRHDTQTGVDEVTLKTRADRLDTITRLYSEDAEIQSAAESVRRNWERPPIPIEEVQEEPAKEEVQPEPPAPPERPQPTPPARTSPSWPRILSSLNARKTSWGAGVLAGLAVLLLIGSAILIYNAWPSKPRKVVAAQGVLEITTSPQGAAVLVNGESIGSSTSPLRHSMKPGTIEIMARMPGYQTATTKVTLAGGVRLPVRLTLLPVVALKLSLPSDGHLAINNEEPVAVTGVEFFRELPVGNYAVKLSTGRNGSVSFAFEVRPEGPAVVTEPPTTHDVSALLISNFGERTRIYTGAPSVDIKLDGEALGQVDQNGLDLPARNAGSHALELGAGKDPRKLSFETGPERTLTLFLESDPNTGTLVVRGDQDDFAISVLVNGKEVRHGNSRKGTYRLPNLKAGQYQVRVSKEGFEENAEQLAEIQKREDKMVTFQFRPRAVVAPSKVRLMLTPDSELIVDNVSVGIIHSDIRTLEDLKPGTHKFRAEKGKQFQPKEQNRDVTAGQTVDVDLRLTASPVPVEIIKSPADSTVTYTRVGENTARPFVGTRQDLPEGDYIFSATAKEYLPMTAKEHISWSSVHPIELRQAPVPPSFGIPDWGKVFLPTNTGTFERRSGGVILFPKPLSSVQFTVIAQGSKNHAHWLLHYMNEKNYTQCVINDEGFEAARFSEGKSEVLFSKKGLPKLQWYTIRIAPSSDGATIQLHTDAGWETLADLKGTGSADLKFGFNVPNGQQLYLSKFYGEGFR